MVKLHKLVFPKMTLYLYSDEILDLLYQNRELFQKGLERGKAIKRTESKKAQYEKKLANQEADFLKNFI
jgi:hypothetical protein